MLVSEGLFLLLLFLAIRSSNLTLSHVSEGLLFSCLACELETNLKIEVELETNLKIEFGRLVFSI